MEPLSITTGCLSLIGAITKVSIGVNGFVRDVRGARSDLDAISRELLSLKTVLELLADDAVDPAKSFPPTLEKHICGIVTNCSNVVTEIEKSLKDHEGKKLTKAAHWAATGRNDTAKLRLSLEAHKSALELAVDMVAISIMREVQTDTQEIRNDTSAIKQDTAQILAEIVRLQAQLPRDGSPVGVSGFTLQRYLVDLTSYAETVFDGTVDGEEGALNKDSKTHSIIEEVEELRVSLSRRNSSSADDCILDPLVVENEQTSLPAVPFRRPSFETNLSTYPKVVASSQVRTVVAKEDILHTDDTMTVDDTFPIDNSMRVEDSVERSAAVPIMEEPRTVSDASTLQLSSQDEKSSNTRQPKSTEFQLTPPQPQETSNDFREIHLFHGNLVVDQPISREILSQLPYTQPPHRDEFTQVRYSAVTCSPNEFVQYHYTLRPNLFSNPRSIEILVGLKITAHTSRTSVEWTLDTIIQNIEYLNTLKSDNRWVTHVAGNAEAWEKIVVVMEAFPTHKYPGTDWDLNHNLLLLEKLGVYFSWDSPIKIVDSVGGGSFYDDGIKYPRSVDGKAVQARIYEYSTRVTSGGNYSTYLQVIFCLREAENPLPPVYENLHNEWVTAISASLTPHICMQLEPGTTLGPKDIYQAWKSFNPNGRSTVRNAAGICTLKLKDGGGRKPIFEKKPPVYDDTAAVIMGESGRDYFGRREKINNTFSGPLKKLFGKSK